MGVTTQGMEAACASGGHVWQLVRIDVHDWDEEQLGVEQVCARCGGIRYEALGALAADRAGAVGRSPRLGLAAHSPAGGGIVAVLPRLEAAGAEH